MFLLSVVCVLFSIGYVLYSVKEWESDTVHQSYKLKTKTLYIELDEADKIIPVFEIPYTLSVSNKNDSVIRASIEYSSAGKDIADAYQNISSIEYKLELKDSILVLPQLFNLKENSFYRDQFVRVNLELPSNLVVKTQTPIEKNHWFTKYKYRLKTKRFSRNREYVTENRYLFERDKGLMQRVSFDEKKELTLQLAEIIFAGRYYSYLLESDHYDDSFQNRLAPDYRNSYKDLFELRELLKENKKIRLRDLQKIRHHVYKLVEQHDELDTVLHYIDALLNVKFGKYEGNGEY